MFGRASGSRGRVAFEVAVLGTKVLGSAVKLPDELVNGKYFRRFLVFVGLSPSSTVFACRSEN